MSDLIELARSYLAMNAAESGADVLIAELADEIERLRNQLAALPDDKRASEDGRRAAIEECAQIADYQAKIPNNTEIQRAHIYSATCIAKAIRALASREPRPAGGGEDEK